MQHDGASKALQDALDIQTFVKTHADALVLEPGCSAMQSCRIHAPCSESSPMPVTMPHAGCCSPGAHSVLQC